MSRRESRRERRQSVTQQIMEDVRRTQQDRAHDATRKQYLRHAKAYVRYCREHFDARTFEDCLSHVQQYCDDLCLQGYTASSVHTYIAAVCAVWGVELASVQKPKRHVGNYVRGRTIPSKKEARSDLNDPRWAQLVEFQRMVGIRRKELMHLTGADLVEDESGALCVRVTRGKGGKPQLQRVDPNDLPCLRPYFEAVAPTEYLFPAAMFANDLNLHALRAECARKYYFATLTRIQNEPGYAAQLEREIRARWALYCHDKHGRVRRLPKVEIEGWYTLRGRNRTLAVSKGLPLSYHKLALLATSVFKLSHWRNDVTVASYLLA